LVSKGTVEKKMKESNIGRTKTFCINELHDNQLHKLSQQPLWRRISLSVIARYQLVYTRIYHKLFLVNIGEYFRKNLLSKVSEYEMLLMFAAAAYRHRKFTYGRDRDRSDVVV